MPVFCESCGACGSPGDESGYTSGGGWLCASHRPDGERDVYLSALESAVSADHPCADDPGCDIAAALRAGFVECAAHLLTGATETPRVDAFIRERGRWQLGPNGFPVDWADWVDWFRSNSRKCAKCSGFTFTDEHEPDSCAHCAARFPRRAPVDDE